MNYIFLVFSKISCTNLGNFELGNERAYYRTIWYLLLSATMRIGTVSLILFPHTTEVSVSIYEPI